MKYMKLLFGILTLTLFSIFFTNIYATEDSENLTLSRIYVEPGNLDPEFSETRDYYTLILNPDVTNLIVQATPTNENLKYEIKGNENLQEGENIITITVYSSDNSKSKVYTINALKTDEPDKYNALLSTLIIDNYSFNEEFFPEIFNYTTKNTTSSNSVEVFAYPQNSNAKVNIKGNENLKNGKNTITVTVTSENGLAKREYNIQIEKGDTSLQSNNEILENNINDNTTLDKENKTEFKTFVITWVIIVVILLGIIFIIKKKE